MTTADPQDTPAATTAKAERTSTPPPGSDAPQEQPVSQPEVMASEVDPGMTQEQRREAGAEPEDRDAVAAEKAHKPGIWTVLHQLIHNGRTHLPGAEIGHEHDFTEADAEPLIAAGMIVAGSGAEVAHVLYRAKLARHQALTESGLAVGPPPEPPPPVGAAPTSSPPVATPPPVAPATTATPPLVIP